MEELRIEVLLVVKHAPDRVKHPAHDGDDRHLLLFAAGKEGFVGGFDVRAALDGDQRGPEEREAQVAVAGAADVARGVHGAALAGARVESGVGHPLFGLEVWRQGEPLAEQAQGAELADAGHAAEPGELRRQRGVLPGEFEGGVLQGFDPLLELAEVGFQVGGDEPAAVGRVADGMKAGLFAGQVAAELDQPAADLLEGQDGRGGRGPRDEVHALEELQDAQRIDRVSLGTGQPGTLEVFDCPRIDDHDCDALRPVQGEGQAQAVNAGGFQADAGTRSTAGEQLEELALAGGGVGQGARGFEGVVTAERDDQFKSADIEAGADNGGLFHGLVLDLVLGLRAPDSGPLSSTDLVNAGSPKRQRWSGLRYSPAWTKKSGDRSNEQGRGGVHAPPCPQAFAASRRCSQPRKTSPFLTARFRHEDEI